MASYNTTKQTSYSPGYYYDDRQLVEQLHGYSQGCSNLISIASQRISEKSVVIHNLQENFDRERNALLCRISSLKTELEIEKQRAKIAKREQESTDFEEGGICKDGGVEITKPEVKSEQVEEQRLKLLEVERHEVQHQVLWPKPQQESQVKVIVQQGPEGAVSQNLQAVETESWQTARETISPIIEFVPQQEQRQAQTQGSRKRKRALR